MWELELDHSPPRGRRTRPEAADRLETFQLQRIDTHPAFDVHLLTPRLWKQHFADNPLRSDLVRCRQ